MNYNVIYSNAQSFPPAPSTQTSGVECWTLPQAMKQIADSLSFRVKLAKLILTSTKVREQFTVRKRPDKYLACTQALFS